jgi:hypothetical protein
VTGARVVIEIGGVGTEEDGHAVEVIGRQGRRSPRLPPPPAPSVGSDTR